jgi:hypothetical protein
MKETDDILLRGKLQDHRLFNPYGNQAAGWTTEDSWFISQQEEGSSSYIKLGKGKAALGPNQPAV